MNKTQEKYFTVADIVERAKRFKGFKTDAELAAFLGISRPTLSNWVNRNSLDYPRLLQRINDVDYNWLLTGKGSPAVQNRECIINDEPYPVELLNQPKCAEPLGDRVVRLYHINAAANLKTFFDNAQCYPEGQILIPNVPKCDAAIYVRGDSMYPILKSGDIVGFKMIHDLGDITYGNIYLVQYTLHDDDYLVVKYVKSSTDPDYVQLVSYNTNHDPMDIPKRCVKALALVKFSVRLHTMM